MRSASAHRIAAFGLTSPDAERLTDFYVSAFGARHVRGERLGGSQFERQLRVRGGALRHTLCLGHEVIDILQFDVPGQPYPPLLAADDLRFQHFAIVVADMDLALSQLRRTERWAPISIGGAQHLPPSAGGVTAFKFRDPDGHPLELLAFPEHAMPPHWQACPTEGSCLGIDHSAICVSNTVDSTGFYRKLGFRIGAQTFNHGAAQSNLDGVPDPKVDVTALCLAAPVPHLELLCYRSARRRAHAPLQSNDTAATRITLCDAAEEQAAAAPEVQRLIVDPDGHHILLTA